MSPVKQSGPADTLRSPAELAEPRSQSRRLFLLSTAAMSLAAVSPPVWAQGYQKFDAPLWAVPALGTQEVIEFFWYGCPHLFPL